MEGSTTKDGQGSRNGGTTQGGGKLGGEQGEGHTGLVDEAGNPLVGGGRNGLGGLDVPHGGGTGNIDAGSDAISAERTDFFIHAILIPNAPQRGVKGEQTESRHLMA
jgi:hypothetical protein